MLIQEQEQHNPLGQGITQKILTIQSSFRNHKDRRGAFERVLRDHYEHLRNSDSESQEYIARSLHLLNDVLKQPEHFDQKLLIGYITEVIHFVESAGLRSEFNEAFIDRIMSVYRQAGYSLINLYLVKVKFFSAYKNEHAEQEKTLLEARKYAEDFGDQEGLVRVLLSLAGYYESISHHKKSIAFCEECEKLIIRNQELKKYYPTVLKNIGINYFTLFDLQRTKYYLSQAKELLEKDMTEEHERGDEYFGKRVLGTVLHYLGRDAERRGNLQAAIAYYIAGHRYQELSSEDLGAIAFYHLRIAELLISIPLLDQARDHLQKSQQIINDTAIAHPQVSAAWMHFYEKAGNYKKAKRCIKYAVEEARQRNTHRLELWCLLKLFLLELRHFRFHSAALVAFQILKTWHDGEFQRRGAKPFNSVSVVLLQILRQLHRFLPGEKTSLTSIQACICPMHADTAFQENNLLMDRKLLQ